MKALNIDGSGGVDPSLHRAVKTEPLRLIPRVSDRAKDTAAISDAGRQTLDAAEAFVDALRQHDGQRDAIVAAAQDRLQSGQLDTLETLRATARVILGKP